MYKLKIVNKNNMKEHFYVFFKGVKNIDEMVEKFWENDKIKKWYLEKNHENDIIISASPEFLLKPICSKLNVKLIASQVDKTNGHLLSDNCYGKEKVNRLLKEYPNVKVLEAYTDSKSDEPIINLANKGYLVIKNNIIDYK